MAVEVASLFPYQIKNRSLFYDRDHKNVSILDRDAYWDSRLRKSIEGWWINDEGTWVCMLPELDWLINIYVIVVTNEFGTRVPGLADLTDKEFIFINYYSCCYGFSGFEGDEFYTCHRVVDDVEKGRKVDFKGKKILDNNKFLYDSHGKLKKYVNAWEYLRQHYLFLEPQGKPLGLPLYDNEWKDAFIMGARNSLKSEIAASNIAHKFYTSGIRRWSQIDNINGMSRFGVGSYDVDKVNGIANSLLTFYKNFPGGYDKDGKKLAPPLFRKIIGEWGSPGTIKNEYVDSETKERKGSGSLVDFGCYNKNKKLFVGGRRACILYDEIGLEEDPATIITAERETLRDKHADKTVGIGIRQGTSGFVKNIGGVKDVFYKPAVHGIYPIPNYWEKPDSDICFFMPDYYVNSSYKDEQGNSIIKDAYEASVDIVNRMIEDGATAKAIIEHEQNNPNWPEQMFTDVSNTILPADQARIRRAFILKEGVWRETGYLRRNDRGVVYFDRDPRATVIDNYTTKTTRQPKENGWVIYEHPIKTSRPGLYKITYDPIRSDGPGKTDDASLVSIIVKKGFDISKKGKQNNVVARWTGRLRTKDLNHEQAILAAEYYSALILHEEDVGDFITYCRTKKKSKFLAPTPNTTGKLKLNGNSIYNAGIKTEGNNVEFKVHGLELYAEWLNAEIGGVEEESERLYTNIDELDDLLILDEIIQYDLTNNFDNTSAMIIHCIWDRADISEKFEPVDENRVNRGSRQREVYEFAMKNLGYKLPQNV